MDILKKPIGGNLAADAGFAGARQDFTSHGCKLQTETHIVTETTDRLFIGASRMLLVDQLGKSWKMPNRTVLARERMWPTFGDVRNGLALNPDRDLKRFRLLPMDDQWIGAPIGRRIELARFDAGNMSAGRQDVAVK